MKPPEQAVRFGVRLHNGRPISHWKFWAHRNEVYLAARSMGYWTKVSLHSSGDWRIAETRKLAKGESRDRLFIQWQRPAPQNGWTESLAVIVPWVAVDSPLGAPMVADGADTTWFLVPANGARRLFKVMFSAPHIDPDGVLFTPSDTTVARFRLLNGETVWLGSREDAMSEVERTQTLDSLSKTRLHVTSAQDAEATARDMGANVVIVLADHPPILHPPTILDVVLGRGNLSIYCGRTIGDREVRR